MNSGPLVSILINNYNYGRFVGEAIESALAQTYESIEIIVVDDGSTDNSREVIGRFGHQVHVVAKDNGGQASAFNVGFAASKGEIICLLDSDDLFMPYKVSRIVKIFERQPNIGWCFHRLRKFGIESGLVAKSQRFGARQQFGPRDARAITAAGNPPVMLTATSGLSFRRNCLADILPMPEVIRIASDNYLKFVAFALKQGWMDSEELSLQHIHGENAYTNRTKGKRRVFGRTGLLTGICLHRRFRILQPLGKKIFCNGLGMLRATGGVDLEYEPLVDSFLQSFAFPARSVLHLRAVFSSAKAKLLPVP